VAEKLASFGVEVHTGLAGTGVVGVLRGSGDGLRTLGLRADLDALPMQEANTFSHRSVNDGAFHGCGHDGHTTMLLAAARYLAQTRNFNGTVRFIFQPAEESGGGGQRMVEEGLFDTFPCDRVFALHNWPDLPEGVVAARSGPMMASEDSWCLTLTGRGGHAAFPHQVVDPIVLGSQIVGAFQTLVSRATDPLEAAVLSVTQFHAGSTHNVIPSTAALQGTFRTLDPEVRKAIEGGMRQISRGIAQAMGATAELIVQPGYPISINDPEATEAAARIAATVVGAENVRRDVAPSMGTEDFSYLLQACPGAYLLLGQGGSPTSCGLHNPHYDFNDRILPIGASLHVALVEHCMPREP